MLPHFRPSEMWSVSSRYIRARSFGVIGGVRLRFPVFSAQPDSLIEGGVILKCAEVPVPPLRLLRFLLARDLGYLSFKPFNTLFERRHLCSPASLQHNLPYRRSRPHTGY